MKIGVPILGLLLFVGCAESPPKRDQIPIIKTQISRLEGFYGGSWQGELDSLMTLNFRAEMGERGKWEAIVVADENWRLSAFSNRSFFYTNKNAEAELAFVYRSPDGKSDSLLSVLITLKRDRNRWLIDDVVKVKPPL